MKVTSLSSLPCRTSISTSDPPCNVKGYLLYFQVSQFWTPSASTHKPWSIEFNLVALKYFWMSALKTYLWFLSPSQKVTLAVLLVEHLCSLHSSSTPALIYGRLKTTQSVPQPCQICWKGGSELKIFRNETCYQLAFCYILKMFL